MKIQNISKICAAVACSLALSANAANILDASQLSRGFSSDNINQVLGLTGATQMKALKSVDAGNGLTKVRFQQEFNGVPVFGYNLAATQTAMGVYTNVVGKVLDLGGHKLQTQPKITAAKAMAMMLKNDKKMGAHSSKEAAKLAASVYNKENDLFVYMVNGNPTLVHRLSYVVPAQNGHEITRPVFFINAHTGEQVFAYDNLQHDKIGTGPGGNTKTGQYNYGTDFGYMDVVQDGANCTMENSNVKTVNLNHSTSGTTAYAYAYTCPENTHKAINGAFAPLNDAHIFGNVVFDMFADYVGSAPLTFQLTMRVHYDNNYENAFWDGSAMTFGDGGSTFHPLVSLDVSAHEVSHGFTEQNSNLVYSGMSGGMNEAFSDMSGEAAEYYMNGGSNDWLVGEQIFKGAGALRYMQDPTQDGRSIGHADDYTGQDVHYTSGVFNKAFYTLANTTGWNTQSAFATMALANQAYWTANSTFDEGACGVWHAAGDKGFNQADVKAAFAAVGVSTHVCDGTPPPPPPGGELAQGVTETFSGVSGSETQWYYNTPADVDTVSFNMSGGSGDADVYVKFGSSPTSTSYDCRPYAAGNTEACNFPSGQEGTYYVMVHGYSSYASANLTADHTTGGTLPPPPPPGEGDSGSVTDINVDIAEWVRWEVEVPAGATDFVVNTTGGTGDSDLYVQQGSAPTSSSYDCRPFDYGNEEICTIAAPAAGTMHIALYGYSIASGVTMSWSYQ